MSTLPKVGKVRIFRARDKFFVTFFRLGSGILPILVIAFTVKGVYAFEGKSDNLRLELRQTERQEKLIDAFRKHLRIAESIESEVILPAERTENKGVEELYRGIIDLTDRWKERNKDKKIFFTLNIDESLVVPQQSNMDDVQFRPVGTVIFFVPNAKK